MSLLSSLYTNPFSLKDASLAFNSDQKMDLFERGRKTAWGAGYDIFVKNPFELTIANGKKIYQSIGKQDISNTERVAAGMILTVGTMYSLMLYGTTTFTIGHLITLSGKGLIVGKKIKDLGESIFLSGAVPTYGLFYALPKYTFNAVTRVFNVMVHVIEKATIWTFNHAIKPLWDKVLYPIFKFAHRTVIKILDLINKAVHTIGKITAWIFNYVIKPLWNKVLYPIFKFAHRTIIKILDLINKAVHTIGKVRAWIFNHAIKPLWNKVLYPTLLYTGKIFTKVLNGLCDVIVKVVNTAKGIFNHTIMLLWNKLLSPVMHEIHQVLTKICNHIITPLSQKIAEIAGKIFNCIFVPIWTYGISPALTKIANVYHAVERMTIELVSKISNAWNNFPSPKFS